MLDRARDQARGSPAAFSNAMAVSFRADVGASFARASFSYAKMEASRMKIYFSRNPNPRVAVAIASWNARSASIVEALV